MENGMLELALELAAEAVTVEGVTCDEGLRLFSLERRIGVISSVGASVFVEIHAHPLDAAVLVAECSQCSHGNGAAADGETSGSDDGWIRFLFVAYPDARARSYFLESVRSARDRVLEEGAGSGEG